MTYFEYEEQTEIYKDRISCRVREWAKIALDEKHLSVDGLSFWFPNTDAKRFLYEMTSNDHIDFSYPITLSFDVDYSGCSSEQGQLDLPPEIICEDEGDWEKYLVELEYVIKQRNVEIDLEIKNLKEQLDSEKAEYEEDVELAEYIRLRKKYEGDLND